MQTEQTHAHEINDTIILMVEVAMRLVTSCLGHSDDFPEAELKMLNLHADMLRSHSAAVAKLRDHYEHPTLNEVGSGADGEVDSSSGNHEPGSAEAMVMLRPFIQTLDLTDGKMIAAVNVDTCSDDASQAREKMEAFWAECSRRISRPNVEFCKAGAVMWDHLEIEVPAHWVAFALSLKTADADLVRATQAAVFSTVATTVGPVCIDSLYHVLATFIHAHPAFREIVQDGEWHLPYGNNTAYRIVNAPGRQDHRAEMPGAAKISDDNAGELAVEDRLLQLDERGVSDCSQFETELRETFGFHFIDGELDSALLPALEIVVEKADVATKHGLAIAALHKLIHGHPRAFGRYFAGKDRPYPRPSKEVQAEIDAKMPTYIAHLQDELAEAIEEETGGTETDGVVR